MVSTSIPADTQRRLQLRLTWMIAREQRLAQRELRLQRRQELLEALDEPVPPRAKPRRS